MRLFFVIAMMAFFHFYCSSPSSKNAPSHTETVADTILQNGKALFIAKCASCHMVNKEMTGPALKGVEDRWPDKEKLYAFIRNSQDVIKTDKYAHDLWLEFNQTVMVEHKDLSDENIQAILLYIRSVSEKPKPS